MKVTHKAIFIAASAALGLFLYSAFWWYVFAPQNIITSGSLSPLARNSFAETLVRQSVVRSILGMRHEESFSPALPDAYSIPVVPRQQKYNLSCEFSAAAAIIYHYTKDIQFAPSNAQEAEKMLMAAVGTSQNPNVGIRMGEVINDQSLYANLNKRFGGAEYYGVHAPPFLYVFPSYGLEAKPLTKSLTMEQLKKVLVANHLLMAWIRSGYGSSIDVALSYGGSVSVVKGEHSVVVYGYDGDMVLLMDPASGSMRRVPFAHFLQAIDAFSMPLLEVYPAENPLRYDFETKFGVDPITGLDRSNLRLRIINESKVIGAGEEIAEVLRDFGYHIIALETGRVSEEFQNGITFRLTPQKKDFLRLLERDIRLASYDVASQSANMGDEAADGVVIIRSE